jgi:GNAT superfamily N-acetyltransferase
MGEASALLIMTLMPYLSPLTPEQMPQLRRFWDASYPELALPDPLLAERVFPPGDEPREHLGRRDGAGELEAILLLSPELESSGPEAPRRGGIRWLGIRPDRRGHGIGRLLIAEAAKRLKQKGAQEMVMHCTPPYYIQPGVDAREKRIIAWLGRQGFQKSDAISNMTVELERLVLPGWDEISAGVESYTIRRAVGEDQAVLERYFTDHWTQGWMTEAMLAFGHRPISLFLAVRSAGGGQPLPAIVGFAAYEVNQCEGCFGPTGVLPAHEGKGLGRRLLWAALRDMAELGRRRCQIGWIGPAKFYERTVSALPGPHFAVLKRRI